MVAVLSEPAIDETPIDELEREIMLGAAQTSAVMCRWLALVAEFDRRNGSLRWEKLTTADWLEWKCGIKTTTARDHVRVARALEGLPKIRRAFSTGGLSYSKVRAITRIASRETEDDMLFLAERFTGNQLESMVTSYARGVRLNLGDVERMEQKRSIQRRRDREGDGWVWTIHVSDEEDALMQRGIDFVRDDAYREARAAKKAAVEAGEEGAADIELEQMSRIDAMLELVSLALRVAADSDGVPKENYLVTVHAEAAAMVSDEGVVTLGDGTAIHPRTAQRLGCDSLVQLSIDGADGSTLNLGRSVRTFTRDQRRVKSRSQPTCEWPGGCGISARYCTMHHTVWWTRGGPTDLENSAMLCRRHHKAVHERGWELVRGHDDSLTAVAPDGRRVGRGEAEAAVVVPEDVDIDEMLRASGIEVRPDYDPYYEPRAQVRYAVDVMLGNHFKPTPEEIAAVQRAVRRRFERDGWRPDLN